MKNLLYVSFLCFIMFTNSEILVTFTEIEQTIGPFPTTRFSELIGDFSGTCQIDAQATLLFPTENPCKTSTFERNLTDLVVITTNLQSFGCFEEESYNNLENLGAVAILNSDPRPAGLSMFRSHIGHNKKDNNIPFIDTNFEFFLGVFLRVAQTQESISVEINNCADENLHEKCYFIAEYLFHIITALKKIVINNGTRPRRFILKYFLATLLFFALISLFNLNTFDGFVWIVGGNYKSNISFFLVGIQATLFFFGTLVSAYYWTFLSNKCFLLSWKSSNNILLRVFRTLSGDDFFKGKGFYLILVIALFAFIWCEDFLLRPGNQTQEILEVFKYFDAVIGFFFLIANSLFVGNIIQTIENKFQQTSFEYGKDPPKFSLLTKFTGYGLFSFIEENNLAEDNPSRKALLMASHLSKWLFAYFAVFAVLVFEQIVVLERMVTFGQFDDSVQLNICSFVALGPFDVGTRMLMVTCLIKGISGPSKKFSTLNKVTREETTQVYQDNTNTSPERSFTPPEPDEKKLTLTPEFLKPTSSFTMFPSRSSINSFNILEPSGSPRIRF
eukprot:snap_masked-scaffold_19-processed-gene-3.38-mRNA-1 protein AED:1.00 eAED:1.00 QI:0/0/0/0/1/1/2/0/557